MPFHTPLLTRRAACGVVYVARTDVTHARTRQIGTATDSPGPEQRIGHSAHSAVRAVGFLCVCFFRTPLTYHNNRNRFGSERFVETKRRRRARNHRGHRQLIGQRIITFSHPARMCSICEACAAGFWLFRAGFGYRVRER